MNSIEDIEKKHLERQREHRETLSTTLSPTVPDDDVTGSGSAEVATLWPQF